MQHPDETVSLGFVLDGPVGKPEPRELLDYTPANPVGVDVNDVSFCIPEPLSAHRFDSQALNLLKKRSLLQDSTTRGFRSCPLLVEFVKPTRQDFYHDRALHVTEYARLQGSNLIGIVPLAV